MRKILELNGQIFICHIFVINIPITNNPITNNPITNNYKQYCILQYKYYKNKCFNFAKKNFRLVLD